MSREEKLEPNGAVGLLCAVEALVLGQTNARPYGVAPAIWDEIVRCLPEARTEILRASQPDKVGTRIEGWVLPLSADEESLDLGWIVTREPTDDGEVRATLIIHAAPEESK